MSVGVNGVAQEVAIKMKPLSKPFNLFLPS
jgi:hypothetical protein